MMAIMRVYNVQGSGGEDTISGNDAFVKAINPAHLPEGDLAPGDGAKSRAYRTPMIFGNSTFLVSS